VQNLNSLIVFKENLNSNSSLYESVKCCT
jgi:hypothetical protein